MFVGIKKRIHWALPLLLVVVLLVSVPLPTNTHFAQAQALDGPPAEPQPFSSCTASDGTPGTYMYGVSGQLGCTSTGTNITAGAASTTKPTPPHTLNFWELITSPGILIAWLLYIVLEIVGVLLAVCASILNLSINISIVDMSTIVSGIAGITTAWTIIRDLVNIVFVFALLFVGINTILGSWSSSGFNTKLIPKIILAALLINFSMLFTKIVIDTSNILTLELYTATKKFDTQSTVLGITESQGLAGAIMNNLHALDFLNGKLTKTGVNGTSAPTEASRHILVGMIMSIILVLIAMFVFLVMAFMLLGRLVVFIILIITSPIAFIGELLPQLKSQAGKWWDTLWGQAFFAPIFFALLLVVLTIINDPKFHDDTIFGGAGGLAVQDFIGGTIASLIRYFIVIYLLISALVIAKSVSGDAGKGVAKLGSTLAGGAVFGGTAFVARGVVGRAGKALSENENLKRLANSNNMFGRGLGRGLIQTGTWTGKQNMDLRGVDALGELGAGRAGGKGGYEQWTKDQIKSKLKRDKMYGGMSETTQTKLAVAQKEELKAKENVREAEISARLAKTEEERISTQEQLVEAEEKLLAATKTREGAEKESKRETAESQISNARREQRTVTTARGFGGAASALWTRVINPSDREAARKFEEDAIKERNKNTPTVTNTEVDTAIKKLREKAMALGVWDESINNNKGGVKDFTPAPEGTLLSEKDRQHRLLKRQANILNERARKGSEQKEKERKEKELKEAVEKIDKDKKESEAKPAEEAKPAAEAKK